MSQSPLVSSPPTNLYLHHTTLEWTSSCIVHVLISSGNIATYTPPSASGISRLFITPPTGFPFQISPHQEFLCPLICLQNFLILNETPLAVSSDFSCNWTETSTRDCCLDNPSDIAQHAWIRSCPAQTNFRVAQIWSLLMRSRNPIFVH